MDDLKREHELIEIEPNKNLTISQHKENMLGLPKYLDREVINERISKIPPGKDRMLITVLWMTGIRITECIGITKKDIDFDNETITIKWLKSRKYKYRNIPLHHELNELLRFYACQFSWDAPVFYMSRQRAFQITKKYLKISPHQLRHSFAVNYLREGGRIENLHRLLGHSRIQTTMEYLKIVPSDLAKELNIIKFR